VHHPAVVGEIIFLSFLEAGGRPSAAKTRRRGRRPDDEGKRKSVPRPGGRHQTQVPTEKKQPATGAVEKTRSCKGRKSNQWSAEGAGPVMKRPKKEMPQGEIDQSACRVSAQEGGGGLV